MIRPELIRLGWTLLHFLWQGTLIAAALAMARGIWGRHRMSARTRYALACAALGLMVAAPLVTFFLLPQPANERDAGWAVPAEQLGQVLPWISAAWFAGVAIFSLRLIGGWRMASRLRRVSVRPAPPEWEQEFDQLVRRMCVARPVRILVSALAQTPMVIGWLQPVVLMPVGALTGLPPEHAVALLAHELGHVLRNDYLANLLQSVAEVLLFYHPAVWWASEQIRQEREQCCDDLAVAVCGGDALRYARALAEIEACRPARLQTAMAAGGGSLVLRIRRLLGQAPSIGQMMPGPGAAAAFVLLLLAGLGAAGVKAPKAPILRAKLAQPVVDALLYNPMFAPPHTAPQARTPAPAAAEPAPVPQAPASAPAAIPDKQHGHRIVFQALFLQESDEPMVPVPVAALRLAMARAGITEIDERLAMRRLSSEAVNLIGGGKVPELSSPSPGVAIETWTEDTYSSFAESINRPLPPVEREPRKTTVHLTTRDFQRKLFVDYLAVIETLPEPGVYRVSFLDAPPDVATPAGFARVTPDFPVPQMVRDGGVIRLELYREPESGLKLVDYVHVGELNQVTPRSEAPHDSYADDAEFNLAGAQLELNGVTQASGPVPQTLRGPAAWVYLPGYGRYTLFFKPPAGIASDVVGEVSGARLTFAEGRNIVRLKCADRIASGSGSYRVYVAREPSWMPEAAEDRGLAQIGTAVAK